MKPFTSTNPTLIRTTMHDWKRPLLVESWTHVVGSSLPPRTDTLHGSSIHFYALGGHVGFGAEAADLRPKDEAFYIRLSNWDALAWYEAEKDKPVTIIRPVDFLSLWKDAGLSELIRGPRALTAYFSPEDRRRGLQPLGELESAAALEIRAIKDDAQRIVIHASNDYPTDLEIVHEPSLRELYLQGLVPFSL